MLYYVIVADWCVDYEAGHRIVGVYTDKEKAKAAFITRVESDDKLLAEEYGYDIFEDSEERFDAGRDGYYLVDHLHVEIECVNMKEEQ